VKVKGIIFIVNTIVLVSIALELYILFNPLNNSTICCFDNMMSYIVNLLFI